MPTKKMPQRDKGRLNLFHAYVCLQSFEKDEKKQMKAISLSKKRGKDFSNGRKRYNK
jgi:hypothetical protein